MRALETARHEADRRPRRSGARRGLSTRSPDTSALHTPALLRSARSDTDASPDPRASPKTLLALQRTAGNGAVTGLVGGSASGAVQRVVDPEHHGGPGPGGTWYRPPGPAGPACCAALAAPAACTTDPVACPAADWEAAIRACLQTVRIPATASFGAEILRRTDPEIADEVADIRTRYAALSPAARSVGWFVHEVQWACNRRVRELEIEYRFNVVFENQRGQPRWGESPPWSEVIAALEAVPDEHLSRRPRATEPMTFRRLAANPAAGPPGVGGKTVDPERGEIEIYDAGVGSAQYLGTPLTSYTTRHEIGHAVEPLLDPAEKQRFKEQVVGWRDYPWHWIFKKPPSPLCDPKYTSPQSEACDLCWELGFLGPGLACDAAALQAFLARVDTAPQVRGDRTYRHDAHFMASFVTANVPTVPEFAYARSSFTDYFAEVYMFALSRPEWLRQVLPAAQTTWLEEHLFSTRAHYDQIIAPVVAQMGLVGNAFAAWAGLQFTKQQLLNVAAQASRFPRLPALIPWGTP